MRYFRTVTFIQVGFEPARSSELLNWYDYISLDPHSVDSAGSLLMCVSELAAVSFTTAFLIKPLLYLLLTLFYHVSLLILITHTHTLHALCFPLHTHFFPTLGVFFLARSLLASAGLDNPTILPFSYDTAPPRTVPTPLVCTHLSSLPKSLTLPQKLCGCFLPHSLYHSDSGHV